MIELSLKDPELWQDQQDNNTDPYGGCIIMVAKKVMEYLEDPKPLTPDYSAFHLVIKADDESKAGGITGFMAGAVVSIVSQCHVRGEEFRNSWNDEYGITISSGIVNPAIITIKAGD